MTGCVLVVGDVMTDIIVVPEGPVSHGTDTRAKIEQSQGGGGANQAVWLAALGVDAHLAARVAELDAARLTKSFEGQGVTAHLAADPLNPTGTLICIVDGDGERSFLTDRGANAALGAADLPDPLLAGADVLHISGYAMFERLSREAVMALIAAAKARGIMVSVDPASSGFLREAGPAEFFNWVDGADIIFPNADEAHLLTGETAPDAQIAALLEHFPAVALKRGAEGAMYAARGNQTVTMPAREVDVVDTTGAGDAFLAGFLSALLKEEPPEQCLAHGILTGSRAVRQLGAQPR